jgi:hypothetical protein
MMLNFRTRTPTMSFGVKGRVVSFEDTMMTSGVEELDALILGKPVSVRVSDRAHQRIEFWEKRIRGCSEGEEADTLCNQLRDDSNSGLVMWFGDVPPGHPNLSVEFWAEKDYLDIGTQLCENVLNSQSPYEVHLNGYAHWQPVDENFINRFFNGKALRTVELNSITISPAGT